MAIQFLEKDLEDIICGTDPHLLYDRGLNLLGLNCFYRQLNLGEYGIADMVTVSISGSIITVTVYELKKDEVNRDTLIQATRYGKALKRIISKYNLKNHYVEFDFVLIGKKIEANSDWVYMTDFFERVTLYTYSYEFDGIRFTTHSGWHSRKENFPDQTIDIIKAAGKSLAFHKSQIPKVSPF